VDGFEGEAGFEAVGVEVSGEGGGSGVGGLGNAGKIIGGDGEGAAGEKAGKFRGGMDGGGAFQFSGGVKGRKDIPAAGVGKHAEEGGFGKLPGDGAGAADGQDRTVPNRGQALGRGDGRADSGKRARAHADENLIGPARIAEVFLKGGDQRGGDGSSELTRGKDFA